MKISVIQKVNKIISEAVSKRSSDIHFESYSSSFRVRYRIDGALQTIETLPLRQKEEFISRIKIMADLDIAEKRKPQDGKCTFKYDNRDIDIRVSVFPTQYGEKVVLRILDKSRMQITLESIGMNAEEQKVFRKAINNPHGMILVTGPTGSGKSTTIYSAMKELNDDAVNITTIEDPIEYNLDGINQSHVRPDIGYTFATSLRSILRQDPDIIMVGEMRDHETAEIAVQSSLTGHMVISTLHTNDAVSTITRLINMGIEPFLVASSVKLIIAQRLVRTICPDCQEEYKPEEHILENLGLSVDRTYIHGAGCEKCNNTGYYGRTAVFEMMPVNNGIVQSIYSSYNENVIKEIALKEGMKTLLDNSIEKIKQNITTPDEVVRKIISG